MRAIAKRGRLSTSMLKISQGRRRSLRVAEREEFPLQPLAHAGAVTGTAPSLGRAAGHVIPGAALLHVHHQMERRRADDALAVEVDDARLERRHGTAGEVHLRRVEAEERGELPLKEYVL